MTIEILSRLFVLVCGAIFALVGTFFFALGIQIYREDLDPDNLLPLRNALLLVGCALFGIGFWALAIFVMRLPR